LTCCLSTGESRTVENYCADIQSAANYGDSHGIKCDSMLNKLAHYHVSTRGLPPCLGHDLFEGVVAVDLFLCIRHLICLLKWFSLYYLNRCIRQFAYIGEDAANKPSPVNLKSDRLGGHAAQNWCLLRMLMLLVGDKVNDANEEVWQLYLLLKYIVELVCCKCITESQIAYMHVLVEDYLDRRSFVFPHVGLRPKHHYLLHYASLTAKFGPLMHLWTMRFESKHAYFKRCIRYSRNFVNVCSTLAERHQLLQAYYSEGNLFVDDVQVESAVMLCVNLYSSGVITALNEFNLVQPDTVVCLKARVKGCVYEKGCYLSVPHVAGQTSAFGKLIIILLSSGNIYFLVEVATAVYLPDKHAYYVCSTDPLVYRCVPENHLWHIGALHGYSYSDGFLLSLKAAMPL